MRLNLIVVYGRIFILKDENKHLNNTIKNFQNWLKI